MRKLSTFLFFSVSVLAFGQSLDSTIAIEYKPIFGTDYYITTQIILGYRSEGVKDIHEFRIWYFKDNPLKTYNEFMNWAGSLKIPDKEKVYNFIEVQIKLDGKKINYTFEEFAKLMYKTKEI